MSAPINEEWEQDPQELRPGLKTLSGFRIVKQVKFKGVTRREHFLWCGLSFDAHRLIYNNAKTWCALHLDAPLTMNHFQKVGRVAFLLDIASAGLNKKQICDVLGVDGSMQIINTMVSADLIKSRTTDKNKRSVVYQLTDRGKDFVTECLLWIERTENGKRSKLRATLKKQK